MRILHVVEPFATGVLSFIQELSGQQVNKGHEVYIAYGVRIGTPDNVEEMFDSRIHMMRVRAFNGALKSILNPKAYKEIQSIYRNIKPDVVHLHSSASGFVGRLTIPCSKTKVFYTPHGYSFLSDNTPWILKKAFWYIEKIAATCKSVTIACSEREYQDAQKITRHSTYVNNGVNVDVLGQFTKPINFDGDIVVCTSGRVIHQKDPILFNQIAERLPHIRFVWIGEGEMQDALTAPNITVTGWKNRDETLGIVGRANFFILTSFGEGLSVSLLEAMALKRICVVRNVRGCRDVIRNGENGFLCDDVEGFVRTIENAIKNQSLGQTASNGAYNDILTKYNSKLMADKYLEIYKSSLGGGNRRPLHVTFHHEERRVAA